MPVSLVTNVDRSTIDVNLTYDMIYYEMYYAVTVQGIRSANNGVIFCLSSQRVRSGARKINVLSVKETINNICP